MNAHLNWRVRLLVGVALLTVTVGGQQTEAVIQTNNALADAETALLNGDYETAISQYTTALDDPSLHCEALYGLGVTRFRAAQYEDAESALTQHLAECPPSFQVLVMRGQVRQQSGRMPDAFADYQQALLLNPGVLDSYLYERMAALDTDQAVYYLRLATEAPREPEGKFALREKLARIYLLIGSPTSALAEYNTLLSEIDAYLATLSQVEGAEFDKDGSLRARIESAAADLEIQNGQTEAGYARLQRIIASYPETSSALPALVELVTANQPVDLLARMRINVRNENYRPVVGVLTDYLNDPATAQGAPAELYLLLGRAQRGQGDVQGALDTFARIGQQYPDDPAAPTAALEQGQTYLQAEDYAHAVEALTAVSTAYPQSPEAPEALLRAAETERDHGDLTRALAIYDQLGAQYPDTEQARSGLFEAGMLARTADPARAADFFGRVGSAQGFVWQGKLLEQTGDADGAQRAWEQATAVEPGTFFAMRGCELLNRLEPFPASEVLHIEPMTDSDRAAAEQWVAQTFHIETVSAGLSPELANDPMLRRGAELWAVGLWAEARAEFDALHKLHRDDPVALLQLAFHYQSIPVYRSSLYAATRLVFASEVPFTHIPRAILELAYPYDYADLLASAAEKYTFDPLLLAALVRQESSFDATNVSSADARGLMQLLPVTAQEIANQLNVENYSENDLYRPVVNIPFGVRYLNSMRAFQDASVAGALLSYNAGPGITGSWMSEAGDDLELLYQTIPYEETKQYLDFIYQGYAVYRHLYGNAVPLCMFEAVPGAEETPAS